MRTSSPLADVWLHNSSQQFIFFPSSVVVRDLLTARAGGRMVFCMNGSRASAVSLASITARIPETSAAGSNWPPPRRKVYKSARGSTPVTAGLIVNVNKVFFIQNSQIMVN